MTADGSEFTPAMREDGIALCSRHGCPLFDVAAGNPQDLFRCSRTGPDTMPICMPWARLLLATVNERAFGGEKTGQALPEIDPDVENEELHRRIEESHRLLLHATTLTVDDGGALWVHVVNSAGDRVGRACLGTKGSVFGKAVMEWADGAEPAPLLPKEPSGNAAIIAETTAANLHEECDRLHAAVEDLTSRLESSEALRKDAYRAFEEAQREVLRLRDLLGDVTTVFAVSPRLTPLQRTAMEKIGAAMKRGGE